MSGIAFVRFRAPDEDMCSTLCAFSSCLCSFRGVDESCSRAISGPVLDGRLPVSLGKPRADLAPTFALRRCPAATRKSLNFNCVSLAGTLCRTERLPRLFSSKRAVSRAGSSAARQRHFTTIGGIAGSACGLGVRAREFIRLADRPVLETGPRSMTRAVWAGPACTAAQHTCADLPRPTAALAPLQNTSVWCMNK